MHQSVKEDQEDRQQSPPRTIMGAVRTAHIERGEHDIGWIIQQHRQYERKAEERFFRIRLEESR